MIKIKINDEYAEFKGHSYYENIGKDIVCASISTLSLATLNYLTALNVELEIIDKNAYLSFRCKNGNEITKKIFCELKLMLKDLESQYPKNIKVEEV